MRRTTDATQLLRIANPVSDQDLLPHAPDSLLEDIINMPAPPPERRRRLRRVLLPAVALIVITATAATAVISRQPEQTSAIACNGENIIPARTGDPIADCAAELASLDISHGELQAFTDQFGGVSVYEAELDVPKGAQPLNDDFRQDVAIIELEASLNDIVTGLDADCYSTDEARPIVEREIASVGLDWGIEVGLENGAPRIADGSSTCAKALVKPETESVMLISLRGPVSTDASGEEPPQTAVSQELKQHLDAECLALDDAVAFAEELFTRAAAEDSRNTATVSGTVDNSVSCSRVDVTVGGSVFVDVRGPDGQ